MQVREAQLAQWNYILVVGQQEQKERTVNVRTRDNVVHGMYHLDDVLQILQEERSSRALSSKFHEKKGQRLDDGGAAAAAAAAGDGSAE